MIRGAQCALCSRGFVVVVYAQEKIHPSSCKGYTESLNCRFSSFLPVSPSLFLQILQKCWFAQFCISCSLRLSVKKGPLRFLCDRCDFFSPSPPQIPGVLSSEDEDSRLTEECGPSQKDQPLSAKLQLRLLPKYNLYNLH